MKKKFEGVKKIWKAYKKYKFRKAVKANLKILVKRIKLWKQICFREAIKL